MMKLLIVAPNPQLHLLIRGLLAPFASEIYDCGDGARGAGGVPEAGARLRADRH
jgi:hypothetical protein